MGSVVDRAGILYFDFRYGGQRCRESSRLKTTPQNRKRCEAALKRIEAEITLGTFDYATYFPNSQRADTLKRLAARKRAATSTMPKFKDFAETWFSEKQVEWRQGYAGVVRTSLDLYILPEFGTQAVGEISKAAILTFRGKLADLRNADGSRRLSNNRINNVLLPLRMILTEAADRYGFVSPWQNIKALKEPRSQVEPFTLDEVQRILSTVRADFRPYYTTRFFTGMRSSEVDGLQWRYVDFDRRQILVRQALVQGRLEQTKTDGSQRDIEMNSLVFDALQAQFKHTGTSGGYVFCSRGGGPLINRNVTRRIWYPLLRHLVLRKRRPYQTRHTAATLWLAAGENPEWIARQMGHTTTEMLFRVYSRYVPNLTRRDGSAFERLLAAEFSSPEQETDHD